ncbi:hypothetical protein ACFQ07_23525 [Actinomadura adrarensis]|uniref:Lipoprotein n=1 Tax=Actinomadura adrarensis TaxID=1819600 RepID=A0ABW3CL39_9ACTN
MRLFDLVGSTSRIVALGALSAVVGCGVFGGEQVCTLEAIPTGVVLYVDPPRAERARMAWIEHCQARRCESGTVRLDDHGDGKRGFVLFPGSERRPTDVRVLLRSSSGEQVLSRDTVATPRWVSPLDEPRCPKGGPQIRLAVTEKGRLDTAFDRD